MNDDATVQPLGIPASETVPSQQTEFFKELVNKLSWALGTSYRVSYNRPREEPRATALSMATAVLADFGYGAHLRK